MPILWMGWARQFLVISSEFVFWLNSFPVSSPIQTLIESLFHSECFLYMTSFQERLCTLCSFKCFSWMIFPLLLSPPLFPALHSPPLHTHTHPCLLPSNEVLLRTPGCRADNRWIDPSGNFKLSLAENTSLFGKPLEVVCEILGFWAPGLKPSV